MLRELLVKKQRDLGLRDGEMARRLGIPRTSYNSVKVGTYRVSLFLAGAMIRAFPDLREAVLAQVADAAESDKREPVE